MSGFATIGSISPAVVPACSDKVTVAGMSGVNPPEICGTNTGYHSKINDIPFDILLIAIFHQSHFPLSIRLNDLSTPTVYAEFGGKATDSISITMTYADLTANKMFNILLKQIPCGVNYKWVSTLTNDLIWIWSNILT